MIVVLLACAGLGSPSVQLLFLEPGPTPSSLARSAGKGSLYWIGCRRSAWPKPTPFRGEREPTRLPRCGQLSAGTGIAGSALPVRFYRSACGPLLETDNTREKRSPSLAFRLL